MTGPTREEVEAALRAWYGTTDPKVLAAWDNEVPEKDKQVRRELMAVSLTAAEPLLRARHVREAVEGLGYSGLVSLACDLNEAGLMKAGQPDLVSGETASEAFVRRSRAALLAALTGEGKL